MNKDEDLHHKLRFSTDDGPLNDSQTQDVKLPYSTFAARRKSASGPLDRDQVPSSNRRAISGSSSNLSSTSHKVLPPIGKTAIEITNNSSLPVDDDNNNGEDKNESKEDNEENTL